MTDISSSGRFIRLHPLILDHEFVRMNTALTGGDQVRFIDDVAEFFAERNECLASFILSTPVEELRWRIMAAAIGYSATSQLGSLGSAPHRALEFASLAHGLTGQRRKYSGLPYIEHPIEVAKLLLAVTDDPAVISAALLHDVIEDAGVTADVVEARFGSDVSGLVVDVTDVSRPQDGNRATRKRIDLLHLASAQPRAKSIKLADLISNSRSIIANDPKFAAVYLLEKANLLEVLGEGDASLMRQARQILKQGMAELSLRGLAA